jgi:hypothetical protein
MYEEYVNKGKIYEIIREREREGGGRKKFNKL